jgi:hypothetical protein
MSRRSVTSQLPASGRSTLSRHAQQQHEPIIQTATKPNRERILPLLLPSRHFSSSRPSLTTTITNPPKAHLLEKPEKFRPPSHPQRLNARRIPRHYAGPALPAAELEAQSTRQYPHTFPNKGTRMYWFLTNRYIHLFISLVSFDNIKKKSMIQLMERGSFSFGASFTPLWASGGRQEQKHGKPP